MFQLMHKYYSSGSAISYPTVMHEQHRTRTIIQPPLSIARYTFLECTEAIQNGRTCPSSTGFTPGFSLDKHISRLTHLKYPAIVGLWEDKLLLVKGVQRATNNRRLLLLDAVLAVHQVHLHIGGCNTTHSHRSLRPRRRSLRQVTVGVDHINLILVTFWSYLFRCHSKHFGCFVILSTLRTAGENVVWHRQT